nr:MULTISPECIES: hypothetical protein [unclassified Leucobacter]
MSFRFLIGHEDAIHCIDNQLFELINIAGREPLGDDRFFDGSFNNFNAQPWHIAEATLLGCADEVFIYPTVARCLAIKQPAAATVLFAAGAVDDSFEVMKMRDVFVPTL